MAILSDFIQEDTDINFGTDARLITHDTATKLADQMARDNGNDFSGVSVYLGLLRSHEYAHLDRKRRDVIWTFWTRYFERSRIEARIALDGVGMLKVSIDSDR